MKPLTTPPFYAVTGNAEDIYVGLCQTTGLDTDFNGCVLDSDLFPIPGLYSAGNNSGNRYIVNYCTPISGMSLGLCMTEGMLLGNAPGHHRARGHRAAESVGGRPPSAPPIAIPPLNARARPPLPAPEPPTRPLRAAFWL